MKADNLDAFRELATDFLAGELSEKEKKKFFSAISGNETFMKEFRLMEQTWIKTGSAGLDIDVPPMSGRLRRAMENKSGGELDDEELDMVSGGVKTDPEIDDGEF